MLGFGHRRHLFTAGQAATETDIRAHVGCALGFEQLLILKDRGKTLAGGNRDVTLLLHIGHARGAVGQHRIFVEVGVKLLQPPPQRDRLGGVHLAVDLDADINIFADRFPHCADPSDRFLGPFAVGFVQIIIGGKGGKAHGGKAFLRLTFGIGDQIVERFAVDMHVAAHPLTGHAAHQFVDRHIQPFAFDVPQRNVNR